MSQSPSKAGSLPWGLFSAICGGFSLGMGLLGCVAGVPIISLPFSVMGLVAGFIERRRTDEQAEADLNLANAGIGLSLAAISLLVAYIVVVLVVTVGLIIAMVIAVVAAALLQ